MTLSSRTPTPASSNCQPAAWSAPPACAARRSCWRAGRTCRSVSAGNVNTRLAKLDAGEYDAIILAAAGLIRLGFESRIRSSINVDDSLPAGGQGAVGIECRTADSDLHALLEPLHHTDTALRVTAERALNKRLNGGCQVPIACYAIREGDQLWLRGLVGQPDGTQLLRAEGRAPLAEAEALGVRVADDLLEQGAEAILEAVYGEAGHP